MQIATNRFEIQKTVYFRCLEGESNQINKVVYGTFPGMERIQHHCIDYNNNNIPVFVRGTYGMVTVRLMFF
jgi:hypothetical protein